MSIQSADDGPHPHREDAKTLRFVRDFAPERKALLNDSVCWFERFAQRLGNEKGTWIVPETA
jgi:hypothetical protein